MVTINELAEIIIEIAGKRDIRIRHVDGPQGVRGRNSDNTRLREVLGWEPAITSRRARPHVRGGSSAQLGRSRAEAGSGRRSRPPG